jgi:hypothetical protein
MQALTILLISICCRKHFEPSYSASVTSVKKLVTWLRCMSKTDDTAKRAYKVVYNIVRAPDLADPAVWADIVVAFPIEPQTLMPNGPSSQPQHMPWTGEEADLQHPFEFQEEKYTYRHLPRA